jgi:hypothetical protein
MEPLLTAICIKKLSTGREAFLKYRNIKGDAARIARFEAFILRVHPEVIHINYYYKDSRNFYYQKRLKNADFTAFTK